MTEVRKESCSACPYRRDVPSGVWAAHEYDKLAEYDKETFAQPPGAFMCHATPEVYCHGWTVVHGRQDHAHEPLAFRLWGIDPDTVEEHAPLFSSGTEAAEHGKRDIEHPSQEAIDVVERLGRKYERLRDPHAAAMFTCPKCNRTFEDLETPYLLTGKAWCPYCDRQVAPQRTR